ncbi:MAG: helix-turn-helix domain-containing protein, partial [Rhodospirillaceae bacterium]
MSEQTSSKPGTPPETADSAGVGALLSASRQRVGEDLRDVAAMLRIRYPYLEAIEEERYAALPGETYAIGFVRAYAEHLGLDSEEVVRRYKAEIARSGTRHDLHFPTPMAETGIPGGAIVFVGLVVAVLVYGGWYLSTAEDGFLSDLVSPLPERLAALVSGDEAPAKADTAAPAATTPAEAKPAEPAPAKPEEAKAEPAQTDPNKAEAAKTEPVKTEPAASEPPKPASESAAAETKPAQSSSSASATPAADKPVEPAPTATTAPAASASAPAAAPATTVSATPA